MAQTRNNMPINLTLPEPFVELADMGAESMPVGHRTRSAFIRGLLFRWAFEQQAQGRALPESFLSLVSDVPQPQPATKTRKK